jgi:transcriptional regulator with XRE-family HTH domain
MWARHLTQTALAKHLGISQPALSKKLRGERPWYTQELVITANQLGVTVGELFGETSTKAGPRPDGPDGGVSLPHLDLNQKPFDLRLVA